MTMRFCKFIVFAAFLSVFVSRCDGQCEFMLSAENVDLADPVGIGSSIEVLTADGAACATACADEPTCFGFVLDSNNYCELFDNFFQQIPVDAASQAALYVFTCSGVAVQFSQCGWQRTHQGIASGLYLPTAKKAALFPVRDDLSDCRPACDSRDGCIAYSGWYTGSFLLRGCWTYLQLDPATLDDGNDDLYQLTCSVVDCVYSAWSDWSDCSVDCGVGEITRTRTALQDPINGGAACADANLVETSTCEFAVCPIDCVYSAWSDFTDCSVACGDGDQTRTRTIEVEGSNGGVECDDTILSETLPCNNGDCPTDCVYSDWAAGDCSAACGGGTITSVRTILAEATNGGADCDPTLLEMTEDCNMDPCPTDCVYSDWGDWTVCTAECGTGSQSRERTIVAEATNGGVDCDTGTLTETQDCNTHGCPVDCVWSQWSAYGPCTLPCDGGTQTRTRTAVVEGANGGIPCEEFSQEQDCNVGVVCPTPMDCVYSEWSDWLPCSVPCGGGTQDRARSIISEATDGGEACDPTITGETQACNEQVCPIDCLYSEYTEWSACSAECGDGTQERTREILGEAANGGEECDTGTLLDSQACNDGPCPTDCVYSDWGDFGECSEPCGGGTMDRTRTVVAEATNGGVACDEALETETVACNEDPCPVDCVYDEWSAFSECSASCGDGVSTSTRVILVEGDFGGVECTEPLSDEQACNDGPCPTDCVYSDWAEEAPCTVACGGGTRDMAREILFEATNGGEACDDTTLFTTENCNEQACAVDCVYGEWVAWTDCDVACGGGTSSRAREIAVLGENGGVECDEALLSESVACNEQDCPPPCDWAVQVSNVVPSRFLSVTRQVYAGEADCQARCEAFTFANGDPCVAYTWGGVGTACVLYAVIEKTVQQDHASTHHFYSWGCDGAFALVLPQECVFESTHLTIIPETPMGGDVFPTFGVMSAAQCEILCAGRFGLPNCMAYAYGEPVAQFDRYTCYQYSSIDEGMIAQATPGSNSFELWQNTCM